MLGLRHGSHCLMSLIVLGLAAPKDCAADVTMLVSSISGNSIQQYNATTGAFIRTFATDSRIDAAYGLTYGPDLNNDGTPDLFALSLGTSSAFAFDGKTGTEISQFIQPHANGLSYPNAIVWDGTHFFISSFVSNNIQEYNGDGTFVKNLIPPPSTVLNNPTGIALNGTTLLVNSSNVSTPDTILQYNTTTGNPLGNFVHTGASNQGLLAGAGLAINGNFLYDSSFGNNTIIKYNLSDGTIAQKITSPLLNGPAGLTFDSSGNLFVGNSYNNNVLKIDPSGTVTVFIPGGLASSPKLPSYLLLTSFASTTGVFAVETPEPSSLVLLGLGGLGLLGYRLRRSGHTA
jgi:hypothetical protein